MQIILEDQNRLYPYVFLEMVVLLAWLLPFVEKYYGLVTEYNFCLRTGMFYMIDGLRSHMGIIWISFCSISFSRNDAEAYMLVLVAYCFHM